MANGIDLATATNLMIRRHAYSVACSNDFAEQSDSGSLLSSNDFYPDTDDSTNDGSILEMDNPWQLNRCACPQATWRMILVPGERVYRCFTCLGAHRDQSAHYTFQLGY